MLWQNETVRSVMSHLSAKESGLDEKEASLRLKRDGENVINSFRRTPFAVRFLMSFGDTMTIILLISAAVSFAVDMMSGRSSVDPFIILAIVFLNSLLSVFQESKAEKAIESLRSLSSPTATVIRDGKAKRTDAKNVVKGDIIVLEKGCFVPADARVTESAGLVTDESSLTGESAAVYKTSDVTKAGENDISDMHDMVWSGTTVTGGSGKAVVVETGMSTRLGSIAKMLSSSPQTKTPLQKRLAKTSSSLGNASLVICLVIFVVSVIRGYDVSDTFIRSVSLAVAAIPEGLPATVTIMLSLGVTEMARHRAVVKKLPSVETLGCATVICTDKTGTLTQNKMTVKAVTGDEKLTTKLFSLCNRLSSPTEQALYDYALSSDKANENYRSDHPIIGELPFDSKYKFMATLHEEGGRYLAIMKGAPEEVEKYCVSSFDKEKILSLSRDGLRIIAVSYAYIDKKPLSLTSVRYIPAGIAGMMDMPRAEAAGAVARCRKAGIKVVMITGDHKETAFSIAKKTGITSDENEVFTQSEILSLPESEQKAAILRSSVFARTTPEFKVKIIEAYRENGDIVAMTGDGVNDAPSLKQAHIGCAMGKSGTDVAREASDMILTDDNFSTIVEAVRYGRGIYANIRRAVHFLISCNMGELLLVITAMLLSFPSPLTAVQILWVNLVTDSLPAIALGMEKPDDSVMERPPVKPDSGLFTAGEKLLILLEGASVGLLAFTAYIAGSGRSGQTMAFCVLSLSQLFHSFNMHSERPVVCSKLNLPLLISFVVSALLQLSAVLISPLRSVFGTVMLEKNEWLTVFALSASILVVGEISKIFALRKKIASFHLEKRQKK